MKTEKLFAGDAENNGMHREIISDNSDSSFGGKWEKEKNKFFSEIGSSQRTPCSKNGELLGEGSSEMKVR